MVSGSILLIKLVKGWSDFGGECELNETPYQNALREESSGCLNSKRTCKTYDS